MKSVLNIIKATIVGGILFLVPIALLVIILGKVVTALQKILSPILKSFPDIVVAGFPVLHRLAALLILMLICFVAGLLARTQAAHRSINWLEHSILGYVPGYKFINTMVKNMTGLEEKEMDIVLARVDDGWQLSFLIEQINNDMYTVFVPDVPNPWSGSVYHLEKDKIIWTNITKKQALGCLRQLGFGSAEILKDRFNVPGELQT
jgi:uncharacterized membrane protein